MRKTGRLIKRGMTFSISLLATAAGWAGGTQASVDAAATVSTQSPIKHVIILIGENRGIDHTFGVYKPMGKGQTISNILSKGIVTESGAPGQNFALAQQFSVAPQSQYYVGAPKTAKTVYGSTGQMPQPKAVIITAGGC